MWPEGPGFGWFKSNLLQHTCTQSIWKWCVWTYKYEPCPGLWHPWLILKQHLSQNLSWICRWEIAQPHTGIQIFFPELYTCFIQQKSLLEKNKKGGSNPSTRKNVVPSLFSQRTSSLSFLISPEKHSSLSCPKLSHLIHLFWLARYVRTAAS